MRTEPSAKNIIVKFQNWGAKEQILNFYRPKKKKKEHLEADSHLISKEEIFGGAWVA